MGVLRGIDGDKLRAVVGAAIDKLSAEDRQTISDAGEGLRTEVRSNGDGTVTVSANGIELVTVPLWRVTEAPPHFDA